MIELTVECPTCHEQVTAQVSLSATKRSGQDAIAIYLENAVIPHACPA